jgi:hypothetical protein
MIRSRQMRWMREKRLHAGFSWGNLKERDSLEDLTVGVRIILKHL